MIILILLIDYKAASIVHQLEFHKTSADNI